MNALPPVFELPICDVCNKPVEYMDHRNDVNFDARLFRVKCHGEVQEVILDAQTMITCEVTMGRAFVRPKLKEKIMTDGMIKEFKK